MKGKIIIFSAPSGSGKSTIIQHVMSDPTLKLKFSISCTSRLPRGSERDGVEYFFLTPQAFKEKISQNLFIEYEEVYTDTFYGTLRTQVEQELENGYNIMLDVDVKGAQRIKEAYGDRALAVFIMPPSVEELEKRLTQRATDAPEVIEKRIKRAEFEIAFAKDFDSVIVNDDLKQAQQQAVEVIQRFLNT